MDAPLRSRPVTYECRLEAWKSAIPASVSYGMPTRSSSFLTISQVFFRSTRGKRAWSDANPLTQSRSKIASCGWSGSTSSLRCFEQAASTFMIAGDASRSKLDGVRLPISRRRRPVMYEIR